MKIGIVGLGAAGVRAAMLLERAGIEVLLFEANPRVGGRLHTSATGDGTVFEAGGEWIDGDHTRCLGLLHELGLEPTTPKPSDKRFIFRGKECTESTLWTEALEDELRVEAATRELCRSLTNPPWSNEHAAELDSRNVGDFLREHTHSDRGLWISTARIRSDEGDDPHRIGLLGWLTGYMKYLDREGDLMSSFRFPGGASVVLEKALQTLKAEPQFRRILRRVKQDASGVTLVFEDGEVKVDRAILTLPPPALEQVAFEPPLTVEKRCAVEACRMSRAVKFAWQFDRAWWDDMGWGGSLMTDGPIQQTWAGALGDTPTLIGYICGEQAMRWTELADPVAASVYELSRIFPVAADSFQRGWFTNWVQAPFARGAFSHLAPQYVLGHMKDIAPPHGKVHFAGEHTATWTGFIEGSFESAERAVEEVLAVEAG